MMLEHLELKSVVMELQMPEKDGFDAPAAIRKRVSESPGRAHLTLIAMTANTLGGRAGAVPQRRHG